MYTCIFLGLFCWSCNTQLENQEMKQTPLQTSIVEMTGNIAGAKKEKEFTMEELRLKVNETRDEINQLDNQIDQLLKGI